MKSFENITNDLFKILSSKDFDVDILDTDGKAVSQISDARIFNFDYKTQSHNYGSVVILLSSEFSLDIFCSNSFSNLPAGKAKKEWYDFLYQMRMFAKRHLLGFSVKDMTKLKFTVKDIANKAKDDPLAEAWKGTRRSSISEESGKVRLIIRHTKNIGEGDQRFRNIDKLFIENKHGERFLVNSKKLFCGRMLARHVAEGGTPYDTFGKHIYNIVTEITQLATFVRGTRNKTLAEDSQNLVEQAKEYYRDLKETAKKLTRKRGYKAYKDSWTNATEADVETNQVRSMFTINEEIDDRIEQCLPVLAKIANTNKGNDMSYNEEFEQWAENLVEGTWSVPDTPESQQELHDLLDGELLAGVDGDNATGALYNLYGDDSLFDEIYKMSQDLGPDADVAPQIKSWIENNAPKYYTKIFGHDQVEETTADAAPKVKLGAKVTTQDGISGQIVKLNPGSLADKTETATVRDAAGKEYELPLTNINITESDDDIEEVIEESEPEEKVRAPKKKSAKQKLAQARRNDEFIGIDTIGKVRNSENTYIFRREFFYTNGGTPEKFANTVSKMLDKAGIAHRLLGSGEVRKAFRGNASTANSSHWWAKFELIDEPEEVIETNEPEAHDREDYIQWKKYAQQKGAAYFRDNNNGKIIAKKPDGNIVSILYKDKGCTDDEFCVIESTQLNEMSTLLDSVSIGGIKFELDQWPNGERSIAADHVDGLIQGAAKKVSAIWAKFKALPKETPRAQIEHAWDTLIDKWLGNQWNKMRAAESRGQIAEASSTGMQKDIIRAYNTVVESYSGDISLNTIVEVIDDKIKWPDMNLQEKKIIVYQVLKSK